MLMKLSGTSLKTFKKMIILKIEGLVDFCDPNDAYVTVRAVP